MRKLKLTKTNNIQKLKMRSWLAGAATVRTSWRERREEQKHQEESETGRPPRPRGRAHRSSLPAGQPAACCGDEGNGRSANRCASAASVTLHHTSQQAPPQFEQWAGCDGSPTEKHGPVLLSSLSLRLCWRRGKSVSTTSATESGARRQGATKQGAVHWGNTYLSRPFG